MARLFITQREIDLISDLSKEVTKDIVGQKVYLYCVREDLTEIHDVYEEAQGKVFDPPVEIEARVDWDPAEITTDRFGGDKIDTIRVYLHDRDLIDKDVKPRQGDYFSYGRVFYEITSAIIDSNVYGQIEHTVGVKIIGKQARKGLIDRDPNGPTQQAHTDEGAIQTEFVQQRGQASNKLGETGDKRALQEKGVLDKPITGPKEVSTTAGNGSENELDTPDSSFYGDE